MRPLVSAGTEESSVSASSLFPVRLFFFFPHEMLLSNCCCHFRDFICFKQL